MNLKIILILILCVLGIILIAYGNHKISKDLDAMTDNSRKTVIVPELDKGAEKLKSQKALKEDSEQLGKDLRTLAPDPLQDQIILVN